MAEKYQLGVLASGSGSTFEAVFNQTKPGGTLEDTKVCFVVCNKSRGNPEAGVYERADRLGVPIVHLSNTTQPTCTLPEKDGEAIKGTISYEVSEKLIDLADNDRLHAYAALGFMKRVVGRAILYIPFVNTHPGPLPETAGLHGPGVQEFVMENHMTNSGPTCHWMSQEIGPTGVPDYDNGATVGHWPVPVTREMREQWQLEGSVALLNDEVMKQEKLHLPGWLHLALESL